MKRLCFGLSAIIGLVVSGIASAAAQEAGDAARGLVYARAVCAGCHGVEAGDAFSPRIGLATFKVIANTPGMTGIALSAWLRTPHLAMPNIVIEADDRANVIAYILSLRDRRP